MAKITLVVGGSDSDREAEAVRRAEGAGAQLHRFPEGTMLPAEFLGWERVLLNSEDHVVLTVSEVLCLRMQRLVRTGMIPCGELLFVAEGHEGEQWREISVGKNGEFLAAWPRGFFQERDEEIFSSDPPEGY